MKNENYRTDAKPRKTPSPLPVTAWLPTTAHEVQQRGWNQLDVILFTGDAYVDHPAFGAAVVGRLLENLGLKTAIVPQPNWRDDLRDFRKLGPPRLFFGVTAGNMDSLINHYTARKRRRSTDAYTPGNEAGKRPDYAVTVYSRILKKLYPQTPVVIGGIEASLRRFTHYDYWSDSLKPTVLLESGADLLLYGMAEPALRELVRLLLKGIPFSSLRTIPQTAFLQDRRQPPPRRKAWRDLTLADHETCLAHKLAFAKNFRHIERESNNPRARRLLQAVEDKLLVVNPPFPPMTSAELDASFDLPYTRLPHPRYRKRPPIPAWEMIRFSLNLHRGCFGGCSFCTISAHQGREVVSRSRESIMREVESVIQMEDFRGYISDLGGPSANMYRLHGRDQTICARCTSPSCIYPRICRNLDTDHTPLLEIYREVDAHPAVKRAFIGSGIRYDLLENHDGSGTYTPDGRAYAEQLITRHVSGRLKVAPEHTQDHVLRVMRKPGFGHFRRFLKLFREINRRHGLRLQLIPYFISGHPGSRLEDMAELAAATRELNLRLEQVQDFTPTPMTLATVMYYTGVDPHTLKPVFSARTREEKYAQHRFFFWYKKENQSWIRRTLTNMARTDLLSKLLGRPPN